jgi:hypothetical protein
MTFFLFLPCVGSGRFGLAARRWATCSRRSADGDVWQLVEVARHKRGCLAVDRHRITATYSV